MRSFLSWQPLITLSRLSYNVYLVHFTLQLMRGAALRDPVNTTFITIVSSVHVHGRSVPGLSQISELGGAEDRS